MHFQNVDGTSGREDEPKKIRQLREALDRNYVDEVSRVRLKYDSICRQKFYECEPEDVAEEIAKAAQSIDYMKTVHFEGFDVELDLLHCTFCILKH